MQMLHPDGSAPARPIDVPDPDRCARARRAGPWPSSTTACSPPRPSKASSPARSTGSPTSTGERCSMRARTCRRSGCWRPPGPAVRSPTTPPTSCTGATPCPTSPAARSGSPSSTSERGRAPPRRPRRPLHRPQRRRPGGVGGHRRGAAADDDHHRHRRRGQSPDRRPRRQGRDRGRLPAVRPRHSPRAGDDARRRQRLITARPGRPRPDVVQRRGCPFPPSTRSLRRS